MSGTLLLERFQEQRQTILRVPVITNCPNLKSSQCRVDIHYGMFPLYIALPIALDCFDVQGCHIYLTIQDKKCDLTILHMRKLITSRPEQARIAWLPNCLSGFSLSPTNISETIRPKLITTVVRPPRRNWHHLKQHHAMETHPYPLQYAESQRPFCQVGPDILRTTRYATVRIWT